MLRSLGTTFRNFQDPEKRKIFYIKTCTKIKYFLRNNILVRMQNWITNKRVFFPIIFANLFGISIYLYLYNDDFSYKVQIKKRNIYNPHKVIINKENL